MRVFMIQKEPCENKELYYQELYYHVYKTFLELLMQGIFRVVLEGIKSPFVELQEA